MSNPYIGEIRMFGGNFAPAGWMFCDGSMLAIADNDALFALIGTTYGGDGQTTFALPDLRSRVPIHAGTDSGITYMIGENGGVEQVTLGASQIPGHNHALLASKSPASAGTPSNRVPAQETTVATGLYYPAGPSAPLHPGSVLPVGGSQPHSNLQPHLAVNFIISLFGIFPTQN